MQYERSVKDNEILNQRLNKAQHDFENQLMQSDQLAGENSQKLAELKLKEDEIGNLKTDISRINKLREGLNRKLRVMEEQKTEMESSRESLRQHIASLERGKSLGFLSPLSQNFWACWKILKNPHDTESELSSKISA